VGEESRLEEMESEQPMQKNDAAFIAGRIDSELENPVGPVDTTRT
jgi:hypothetical protein